MGLWKYNLNSAGYNIFEKNCKFFNPYIGISGQREFLRMFIQGPQMNELISW